MSTRVPWYGLRRWRRRARAQLRDHPLCAACLRQGLVVPAEVADHIEPHNGDANRFWRGELQSLCHKHHNINKAFLELHGYDLAVGLDGWPLDKNHPANR